jgi:hypothetical protein
MLPYLAAAAVSLYLPYLEIVGGASLVLKRAYTGGLLLLLVLVVLFTVALVLAWVRGLDISCGCFGSSRGTVNYPWYLTRDLLIFAALSVLQKLDQQLER